MVLSRKTSSIAPTPRTNHHALRKQHVTRSPHSVACNRRAAILLPERRVPTLLPLDTTTTATAVPHNPLRRPRLA